MISAELSADRRLLAGVFFISLATLMYELVLTRVFSVVMWYHFASMAISLALFGMGVAALFVYLRKQAFPAAKARQTAARCSVWFALSVTLFFAIFVYFRLDPQFGFRILSFFHQPFYQPFQQGFYEGGVPAGMLPALAALYLLTALPFFFSGVVLAVLFTHGRQQFSRLYFWDLLGAGCGCLLIILLLKLLGGMTAILAIALTALVAAWLFATPTRAVLLRRFTVVLGVVLLAAGIGNLASGYAEIRFVRGRYEPNLLWSAWNSFSRVAVYPSQSQEMAQSWGLSRTYHGPVPEQLGLVVDDTGYTTLYRADQGETEGFFQHNVIALPYQLNAQARALIIGPGGGKDVRVALAAGAEAVTAVELNPLVARAVNDEFGSFTGELYRDPRVTLAIDEGRNYVRRAQQRYDVIQASAVFGRTAPAAGAFTLSENNLYTLEAFQDYWDHLSDRGVLTIARFIFERETLRLVSLGLKLLSEQGVDDPGAHLAVIKERGLANVMLKRTPFTAEEVARLRSLANEREFRIVYLPDDRDGNSMFQKLIASGGSPEFLQTLPFDLSPTDDDRPFFYYMLKPADFVRLLAFPDNASFEDRALLTLRNLLLVVTGFVVLFLLLPLLLTRRRALSEPGSGRRLLYFCCLGLGFMLIEIGLLRRFILFLGQPIFALAVILCALLLFSGFGSLLSGRCPQHRVRPVLLRLLLALVLLSIGYIYGLPVLLDAAMTASLVQRCLLAVVLLAPLGLLLGMPLPLGMRLWHTSPDGVAWSWGLNSATSVWGALLAVVMAMNFGFNATLFAGTAVYLVAAAVAWTSPER